MAYTPIPIGTPDWGDDVNDAFTSQDGRITATENDNATQATQIGSLNGQVSSLTSTVGTQTTQITTLQGQASALEALTNTLDWQPQDHGLKAWTQDPASCSGATGIVSVTGTIYYQKVILRTPQTITNIVVNVTAVAVTPTAGQNLVGLYTSAGVKLAESADQGTAWSAGGVGTKTIALLVPQAVTAGTYYVAIMSNAATPAAFLRGNSLSSSVINTGGALRFINTAAAHTALPASFTPGSANTDNNARWVALS